MSHVLVVGAGLSGAVVARELAEAGHKVNVIEKKSHVGGNCFDYINELGIRVHMYGPHIFHTNNKDSVDWLGRFTNWVPYQHKVKAILADGRYVTLPVNKETKEIVGEENIIDTFIRPYTKNMWNKDIEELDPSILSRVPIRDDMNELYFPDDEYQFLPDAGYTDMILQILNHININVQYDAEFKPEMGALFYDYVFNSMPIDQYFNYVHGELPYRSMKFNHVDFPSPKLLPVPTVNFTHNGPYTRMTEWKNYPGHGVNPNYTTITFEEPCDYKDNNMERYYPVKDSGGVNRDIYKKYRDLVPERMEFIGRCGLYVYINMDQAVASSMAAAKRFISANPIDENTL